MNVWDIHTECSLYVLLYIIFMSQIFPYGEMVNNIKELFD